MKKMLRNSGVLASIACLGSALAVNAQVILVDEDFSGYSTTEEMQSNWSGGAATLDTTLGNPAPSAFHPSGTVNNWTGSSLSVDPATGVVVLRADIYDNGNPGHNTLGFRTGADPLFEMGHYDFQAGQYNARILGFAGNDNWVTVHDTAGEPGWNRWEATFDVDTVTISLDLGIDGIVDATFVSSGTAPNNPFTDLRFGGPSNLTAGDGANYDNIVLSQVPEPSTYAVIFGALALVAAFGYRRRAGSVK